MTAEFPATHLPFEHRIEINLTLKTERYAVVRMLDERSRIVRMVGWELKAGSNKIALSDLQDLPAGEYKVQITGHDGALLYLAYFDKR
ncbi:MAG TPA: hypothetical protein VFS31_07375 [Chitinophagaceae bacterium]|jgi:hypothetical protein|nr:hypothetical protein [Chitinophagaceae bacterium]